MKARELLRIVEQHWRGRSPRDRLVLAAIGATATLLALFQLWWTAREAEANQARRLPLSRAEVTRLRGAEAELARLRALAIAPRAESDPLPALRERLRAAGLTELADSARLAGEGRIQLTGGAPAAALFDILAQLQRELGLRAERAQLLAERGGRLRIDLLLATP